MNIAEHFPNRFHVEPDHIEHKLLPLVSSIALSIEKSTDYVLEISSNTRDDGTIYFQIDEKYLKFYFLFFEDRMEFAFDNFDNYGTIKLEELRNMVPFDDSQLNVKMKERNFPKEVIESCAIAIMLVFLTKVPFYDMNDEIKLELIQVPSYDDTEEGIKFYVTANLSVGDKTFTFQDNTLFKDYDFTNGIFYSNGPVFVSKDVFKSNNVELVMTNELESYLVELQKFMFYSRVLNKDRTDEHDYEPPSNMNITLMDESL